MLKSERYTSKYLNKSKLDFIKATDASVRRLKNSMSLFCHENIIQLVADKNFQVNYKLFRNDFITPWETQTIFQDIIKFYKNSYFRRIRNVDFGIQDKIVITYYKIDTKHNKKGDVKSFGITRKQTNLSKLLKYLVFKQEATQLPPAIQNLYDHFKNKGFEERLLRLVASARARIRNSVKLIEFTTGTYRKAFSESGLKDKSGRKVQYSGLCFDDSNNHFKHWFKYRTSSRSIYIPLEINDKYHHFNDIRESQYLVKVNGNKVDIIGNRDFANPDFQDYAKCEGIDLNVKHNFCTISNGKIFDYDREYIKDFCSELKKLDKIGMKNITSSQKKYLEKLVRRNEWYFKKLIHDVVKHLKENKITDVVMEDLSTFGKTFIKNEEFEIKYSRLVRLLRLSNISAWLTSQAEKQGIRVHLTSPCYSSQQCPVCGSISRDNRKDQEHFECTECRHSANADLNASINLRSRFTSDVLKSELHVQDEFNRLIPKKLKKEKIKEILLEHT